jgi:hypothetical protein
MVGAHHVDDAIVTMLKDWDRTYLQEVARRSGDDPDELAPFRTWRVSYELEHMPEDQTPTCIIANRGIQEPPRKSGSRRPGQSYQAIWNYRIGAVVSARGKKVNASPIAQRRAKEYVLAIRTVMVQKRDEAAQDPTVDTILGMIDWVDEGYDGLTSDSDRTICLAWAEFYVAAKDVTTWGTGPLHTVPEPDPADPDIPVWPQVDTVVVETIKVPTDERIP